MAVRHLVMWFKDRDDWHSALQEYVGFPETIRSYELT
ncbi:hypothetical protein AB0K14_30340 [Actinosynnema sp. NPDC050801]